MYSYYFGIYIIWFIMQVYPVTIQPQDKSYGWHRWGPEDAEDTATLNELDDEQLGEDIENENEDYSEEDKDEEIDPAVAENDAAIVDEVAADVENDSDLPTLTRDEVNLGRFAVTKVKESLINMCL